MESIEPRSGELRALTLGDVVRAVAATGEEFIITDSGADIAVIVSMADYERLHEQADVIDEIQVEARRVQSQIDDNRSHPERRRPRPRGITLDQIQQSDLYTRPTSTGYQDAMLEMVERGRDDTGRVGDHHR